MSIADAIANAGGVPGAFDRNSPVGASVTGRIISAELKQVINYEDGVTPETWDDGQPKQQVVITLQTSERDQSHPDDDGKRRVYVKWWGDQRKALLDAVKSAGDKDLRAEGQFSAQYLGLGQQENSRLNPPKLFSYQYQSPQQSLDLGGELAQPQQPPAPMPAPQPQQPPAQGPAGEPVNQSTGELGPPPGQQPPPAAQPGPVQQPAPQPAAGQQPDWGHVRSLINLGLYTDQQIAENTGASLEQVAAIKNMPPF